MFSLKTFRWNIWLEAFFVVQGISSFIGVLIYSYAHRYHNVGFEAWGMFLWVLPALPLYFYLIFYAIFNFNKLLMAIKIGWLQIVDKVQGR